MVAYIERSFLYGDYLLQHVEFHKFKAALFASMDRILKQSSQTVMWNRMHFFAVRIKKMANLYFHYPAYVFFLRELEMLVLMDIRKSTNHEYFFQKIKQKINTDLLDKDANHLFVLFLCSHIFY